MIRPPLPRVAADRAAPLRPPELSDPVLPGELPALVRLARSVLKSDDLAWDAVQETLLRTWSRAPDDLGDSGDSWDLCDLGSSRRGVLRQLTFRTSLQLLRSRRRRERHEGQRDASFPSRPAAETPLESLEREERCAALRDTVATLAEPHRQVLELHYFEEADYGRIAADLALAPGTVGSRLHRARGALRRRLEARAAVGTRALTPGLSTTLSQETGKTRGPAGIRTRDGA